MLFRVGNNDNFEISAFWLIMERDSLEFTGGFWIDIERSTQLVINDPFFF